MLVCNFLLQAKNEPEQCIIEVNSSDFYKYNIIQCTITNTTDEEFVLWFSGDSTNVKSEKDIVHDHFIKRIYDFSLFDLFGEDFVDYNSIMEHLDTFQAILKPHKSFYILIINENNSEMINLADKIVLLPKKTLDEFLAPLDLRFFYTNESIIIHNNKIYN